MSDLTMKISRWDKDAYDWMPYIEAKGRGVRVDPPSFDWHRPNRIFFKFYPVDAVTDFEGDGCCLAQLDVLSPNINPSTYPHLEIQGYVDEMCASEEVEENEHEGGYRYCPRPDRDWTPGLVKIVVYSD